MARERDRVDMDRDERVVVTADDDARPVAERTRTAVVDREPLVRRDVDEDIDYRRPRDWRVEMPPAFNLYEDRVHWGAVWAGLVTAFTTMIILGLLGVAVGLTAADEPAVGAAATAPGAGAGTAAAWWAAISGIAAFFMGGWVAGRMAAIFSRRWGAWNGALVFMLALPLTMLLAGLGSAGLLGAFGQVGTGFGIGTGIGGATGVGTGTLVASAWWSLIGLLVALGAAALGGAAGTRTHVDLEDLEPDIEPRGGSRGERRR